MDTTRAGTRNGMLIWARTQRGFRQSGKFTLYSGYGIQFHMETWVFQYHSQSFFVVAKFHIPMPNPLLALWHCTFIIIIHSLLLFIPHSNFQSIFFVLQSWKHYIFLKLVDFAPWIVSVGRENKKNYMPLFCHSYVTKDKDGLMSEIALGQSICSLLNTRSLCYNK